MGKALYRKYRSKNLSEIVGQEHITQTLDRALKQNMISHAYLLTGPRGVGKTSIARILAYEVNGLPYDEEGTHLDIIEIDAASNRRIDEIRELKDKVNIAPTSAKYKVYIIDEVHMLTREAFNALLKTLEEPPDHAIFILATTEAHKVPDTIISRTQRFTFKPVDPTKVAEHLKQIAKSENISIDDDALYQIAVHGDGSFRDSISLLDQIRHTNQHVTLEHIQNAVGLAPNEQLSNLLQSVQSGSIKEIHESLEKLRSQGVQPAKISGQLIQIIRQNLVLGKSHLSESSALELLRSLISVASASDASLELELVLYSATISSSASQSVEMPVIITQPLKIKVNNPTDKEDGKSSSDDSNENILKASHKVELKKETKKLPQPSELDQNTWNEVLATLKLKQNTLYGIARMAVPKFEQNKLVLTFNFAFHHKKFADTKSISLLRDIILNVTGQDIEVDCILEPKPKPKPATINTTQKTESLDLATISNIFGGAEIVE